MCETQNSWWTYVKWLVWNCILPWVLLLICCHSSNTDEVRLAYYRTATDIEILFTAIIDHSSQSNSLYGSFQPLTYQQVQLFLVSCELLLPLLCLGYTQCPVLYVYRDGPALARYRRTLLSKLCKEKKSYNFPDIVLLKKSTVQWLKCLVTF